MKKKETRQLLDFISEAGLLKRVKRSGWWVLGVKDPESVADHSFRCAMIAYVIARMEKVAPYKVLVMSLFNDIHESRIGDLHKMAQRYINGEDTEDRVFDEQMDNLPGDVSEEMVLLRKEYRMQRSKESIVARDADILECLIQAKEYYEHGFKEAVKFMKKAPRCLETKTARQIWKMAESSPVNEWWEQLSEFKR
ncbi:MAG: HD domain-containing protein [Candidatus Omnitrophica bacterium]|nr:HD domain-containing protein [Candidatus Omnitrophota bacterium]